LKNKEKTQNNNVKKNLKRKKQKSSIYFNAVPKKEIDRRSITIREKKH